MMMYIAVCFAIVIGFERCVAFRAPSCLCESTATREALIDLFGVTNGPTLWLNAAGWNSSDSVCDWWGVSCLSSEEARSALHIDLSNNQLTGTLPASIHRLDGLVDLDLSWNALSGTLPQHLPSTLKRLNLQKNDLTGEVPDESWGRLLTSITFIALNSNRLVGSLPILWTNMGRLEFLYMENNSFTGSVPHVWGTVFPHLQVLNLHHNELSGLLPPSMAQLETLRYLNMHHNNINSTLPDEWGSGLPSLMLLYLDHNWLHGPLPESWGGMGSGLGTFILCDDGYRNRFCGGVGPAWRDVLSLASAVSQCGDVSSPCAR